MKMICCCLVALSVAALLAVGSVATAPAAYACVQADKLFFDDIETLDDEGRLGEGEYSVQVLQIVRITTVEILPGVDGLLGESRIATRTGHWSAPGQETPEPWGIRNGPIPVATDDGVDCPGRLWAATAVDGHVFRISLDDGTTIDFAGGDDSAKASARFDEIFGTMAPIDPAEPSNGRVPEGNPTASSSALRGIAVAAAAAAIVSVVVLVTRRVG